MSAVAYDLVRLAVLAARSHRALAAENLFLRKQLALFQERKARPRRADDSTRWIMAALSRMFPWRDVLINVTPDTLVCWHRKGFRLFWRWRSKPTGRPRLPKSLRQLIREIAFENTTWGEERIANELKLKLGILVSPRTVERYLQAGGPRRRADPQQRWLTFVHNHAKAIVACDFFVVVTATFRTLYVFVIMDVGTRRILHPNVTAHPTADWTLQQLREALPGDHAYRFLIHDRDSIFSKKLDNRVTDMGQGTTNARAGAEGQLGMRTPRRKPSSRVSGLLDTPQRTPSEDDRQRVGNPLQSRQAHSSLGPGLPEPAQDSVPASAHRHKLPSGFRVVKKSVLGGLHHEYRLVKEAA
ncbi:MAG TPA: hypothetical protein VNH18_30085 [Bryobacteraceae bacterium]|nr:hypothetical protein [Bryobacteraceae bacterium]